MKKVVLPLVVVSIVAAGATVGSVKYSADQAHAGLIGFVSEFNKSPQNKGVFSAELRSERGFADGRYQLDVTIQDPEVQAVFGLDRIPLDIQMKGGVLSASFESQLAPSTLLSRLQEGLSDKTKAPVRLLSEARYNPLEGVVIAEAELLTELMSFEWDDGSIEIAASKSQMHQQGNEVESSGDLPQLLMVASDGTRMAFNGIKIDQDYTLTPGSSLFSGLTSAFDVKVSMQQLQVTEPDTARSFAFNDLSVVARQQEKLPRVFFDVEYGMGAIDDSDSASARMHVKKPTLDLTLDLDNKAYQGFVQQINALPPEQQENPFILMGIANGLTTGGVGVQLNQLDLKTQEGELMAEGQVSMSGFDLMRTMQNPNALLQKTNAQVSFKADGPLLDVLLKPRQIMQLQDLTAQGLVRYEKGQYSSDLKIDNGRIVVNGVPLS